AGQDGQMGPQGPQGPKGDSGILAFGIAGPLSDVRLTSIHPVSQWIPLTGRSFILVKQSDASKLKITYQDTLGARATTFNACQWRIVVDGNPSSFFSDGDMENPTFGWRIHNGAHQAWAFNVPAGTHEIRV